MSAEIASGDLCGRARVLARLFFSNNPYEYSDEGEKLADCIQSQIVQRLGTVDRGITDKIAGGYDSYVVKHTHCPACLVETAFIDNPADNILLADNQDDFARAIALGITDYVAK